MTNLEAAAEVYARRMEAAYIAKRGGRVPVKVAFDVYCWAFNRFVANPEASA